jgi:hypothetical protein
MLPMRGHCQRLVIHFKFKAKVNCNEINISKGREEEWKQRERDELSKGRMKERKKQTNKIGNVYSLEYIKILKVFFTPYHWR